MAGIENILAALPAYRTAADSVRELLLANLAMIGEIPAPTFAEQARAECVAERLASAGLHSCSVDGKGNAAGILTGADSRRMVLIAAHSDTLEQADPGIQFAENHIVGPFVGDNSIALAAMCTLPLLLERLELRLQCNVVFVAASRAEGRGNLEGMRHFLANSGFTFQHGICLESFQFGRLNYANIGMLRGEIIIRLPDNYDWAQFGSTGSIIPMSDVINRISRIPLPRRPMTSIIMGSIEGGLSYNNIARETRLRFEVRGESIEILKEVKEQIEDVVEDIAGQSGTRINLDIFAQREPGGIDVGHPLVRSARAIITALGASPMLYATTSMMSALKDAGMPALTLGVTKAERKSDLDEIDEAVEIAPISLGMAQLVAILQCIDGGLCS